MMAKRLAVLVIFSLTTHIGQASLDNFSEQFIKAAQAAKPSVVNIIIYNKTEKGLRQIAHGSGTVIFEKRYIVTNYHVVSKGSYFQIIASDGTKFELKNFTENSLFLADTKTDLALLQIENPDSTRLIPIQIDDSDTVSEGEWVLAIGNPYGLNQSITSGIISSKGRDNIGFADIEDFLQTDVSINPGNSGGPLINLHGKMIGINTAIRSISGGFQGISFAIPSNTVRHVCNDLISFGRVRRGWLGFMVKEQRTGKEIDEYDLEIISVIKNSPAEAAGLIKGDIITEINSKKVKNLSSLIKIVGSKSVGSKINLTINRDNRKINIALILREKKEYKRIQKTRYKLLANYGLEIDINSGTDDIVVSFLSLRALDSGLRKGDIITGLNGKKIATLDDFYQELNRSHFTIRSIDIVRDRRVFEILFPE